MTKSYKMGIIAAGIAVLAIGGGTLALNQADKNAESSVKSKAVDHGMMTSKLSALEGDEFDEAFINDMVEHHAGAVAMAKLVDTEAKDPKIKTLALAIIDTQTKEIDDMTTWAKKWNYEFKSPKQSAIDEMTTGMNGKTGAELDTAFLSDMIGHHQSAIDMALLANTNSKHVEIKTLAQQIETTQKSEIQLMMDIARDANYTLKTTEGHNHDGDSDNHGDDTSHGHSM